ncbi:hypothetical protein CRG98_019572 [Punica granatum]|uniref:Uncharacterized protein n=1 Tax=Punica granatum TaxID=22663 RepID=A0A2I0JX34_PUNGR|nr:hypothetical protein CRG98_019572 [Punica granatum]
MERKRGVVRAAVMARRDGERGAGGRESRGVEQWEELRARPGVAGVHELGVSEGRGPLPWAAVFVFLENREAERERGIRREQSCGPCVSMDELWDFGRHEVRAPGFRKNS